MIRVQKCKFYCTVLQNVEITVLKYKNMLINNKEYKCIFNLNVYSNYCKCHNNHIYVGTANL